jgi:hypothetical protein
VLEDVHTSREVDGHMYWLKEVLVTLVSLNLEVPDEQVLDVE